MSVSDTLGESCYVRLPIHSYIHAENCVAEVAILVLYNKLYSLLPSTILITVHVFLPFIVSATLGFGF